MGAALAQGFFGARDCFLGGLHLGCEFWDRAVQIGGVGAGGGNPAEGKGLVVNVRGEKGAYGGEVSWEGRPLGSCGEEFDVRGAVVIAR